MKIERAWYQWYVYRIGIPGGMDLPLGELLDLIAVEQIKHEGFALRDARRDEDFWALMERE